MKTELPHRSMVIKERLAEIVKMTLGVAEQKLGMIILFGSYARGDWVQDEYIEQGITYSYQSDLDILLVAKKGKYAKTLETRVRDTLETRLNRKTMFYLRTDVPWVTFIVEPIDRVNSKLEQGHYFFCDIKDEGVMLYDSKEFRLSEPKELAWQERKELAKAEYEYWFSRGQSFMVGVNIYFRIGDYALSAFMLHQATESFYNAILMVFTGYKPKMHNIRKLGSIVGNYDEELWQVFPKGDAEQQKSFNLLEIAYTAARYDKDYVMSRERLLYLKGRVSKLEQITERVCNEQIYSK